MNDLGKALVVIGLLAVGAGVLLWSGVGRGWLGRLPGDLHYTKGHTSFYFPLATCLLLSFLVSFLLWILRRVLKSLPAAAAVCGKKNGVKIPSNNKVDPPRIRPIKLFMRFSTGSSLKRGQAY